MLADSCAGHPLPGKTSRPPRRAASLFNVSRQTLIYYDKIGLFKPAVVNEREGRFYSPIQIPLIRLIRMLRDLGLEFDESHQEDFCCIQIPLSSRCDIILQGR